MKNLPRPGETQLGQEKLIWGPEKLTLAQINWNEARETVLGLEKLA
jgi:hypothetical protein